LCGAGPIPIQFENRLGGGQLYLRLRLMKWPADKNPAMSNKRNATQNLIFLKPKASGIVIFQSHWKMAVDISTRKIRARAMKI